MHHLPKDTGWLRAAPDFSQQNQVTTPHGGSGLETHETELHQQVEMFPQMKKLYVTSKLFTISLTHVFVVRQTQGHPVNTGFQ